MVDGNSVGHGPLTAWRVSCKQVLADRGVQQTHFHDSSITGPSALQGSGLGDIEQHLPGLTNALSHRAWPSQLRRTSKNCHTLRTRVC